MTVPLRLAAFAALLALVLGGSALAGAAIDPTDAPPASSEHAGGGHAAEAAASGLAVADGGYALQVDRTRLPAGRATPLRLRITDAAGRVVRDLDVEHERRLHLIVVRRDARGFQHLHPRRAPDGSWGVDLDTTRPGVHRAYADVTIDGTKRVLAADLFVPGRFDPQPLPAPAPVVRATDPDGTDSGIDVALRGAGLRAGRAGTLVFSASRDGRAVAALQPYLGAKGHLVALREGDLAYLHVHPADHGEAVHGGGGDEHAAGGAVHAEGGDEHAADHRGDGHGHDDEGHADRAAGSDHEPAGETRFAATFPTAGRYRLFLQIRVDDRVRTAAFTVEVAR